MKIALIPPKPDLHRYADESRLQLMLAHLADDPTYRMFYQMRARRGDYVILDNGACENALPMSLEELLEITRITGVREVVLPDVQLSAAETLAALEDSLTFLRTVGGNALYKAAGRPRFMFVPQGEALLDWTLCLNRGMVLLQNFGIRPVVAIAKQYNDLLPQGRLALVNVAEELGVSEIHLLGWAPPWESLSWVAANKPWVRSVDSAKPFNYARHGVKLEPGKPIERIPRDDDYFDVSVEDEALARVNIQVFRNAALGRQ